jgi:hypothetical protein
MCRHRHPSMPVHTRSSICICICAYMSMDMFASICPHRHPGMPMHTPICMYMYIYTWICLHQSTPHRHPGMPMHISICMYMHVYAYIWIYLHQLASRQDLVLHNPKHDHWDSVSWHEMTKINFNNRVIIVLVKTLEHSPTFWNLLEHHRIL